MPATDYSELVSVRIEFVFSTITRSLLRLVLELFKKQNLLESLF